MFIQKVSLGSVTMSEAAPVWDVYLDETFWTPISNTSWVTDHWYQFGIDNMILQVNGSWYLDFRPIQIRLTGYNPATQAWNILLQDSGLNTIATISMPPQATTTVTANISFGELDIFRFYNVQGIFNGTQTNIEFLHYP
jgi:hypothetical protein